jgi:hypothetical protein
VPTGSKGRLDEVIMSGVGITAMVPEADADWAGLLLSLTVAVNAAAPPVVGVPEITPVDDRVKPAGRLPEAIDQL